MRFNETKYNARADSGLNVWVCASVAGDFSTEMGKHCSDSNSKSPINCNN